MEWRPILSAPKDGTRIIAWLESGAITSVHWDGRGFLGRNCYYDPQYWMPCPEPPDANQHGASPEQPSPTDQEK